MSFPGPASAINPEYEQYISEYKIRNHIGKKYTPPKKKRKKNKK